MSRARDRFLSTAGWTLAAVALWLVSLVVAWLGVNSIHVLITPADAFPASLVSSTFSYVYAGIAPLIATLLGVWWLSRAAEGRSFRLGAVGLSLVFGSWFGFYLVGPDEIVIQIVLVAWALFGALVPRAFGAPRIASGPTESGPDPSNS